MTLQERVKVALERLKPKFDELAAGWAELVKVDEEQRKVTLKLVGGRLLWCGAFALGLWVDRLQKEEIPEIEEILTDHDIWYQRRAVLNYPPSSNL